MTVFLLILVLLFLLWPWIVRWLRAYMARRAEDMVRRMAGMPPRREEERRAREREKERERGRRERRRRADAERAAEESLRSMREYAEDVEFTEVREFSSTSVLDEEERAGEESMSRRVYRESQVSDAEYTEVKEDRNRRSRS